jgi:outer membrane protein OmpA-like peptidoglycan-associated protein
MLASLLLLLLPTPAIGQEKAGEGVWRNYDFVTGKTVLVATDFSAEPVGRFPASQLTFVQGNMQIVELNGERVLEVSGNSTLSLKLPRTLPPDFTLEFEIQIGAPNMIAQVHFVPVAGPINKHPSAYLYLYSSPGVQFQGKALASIQYRKISDEFVPIRLQVDGEYLVMYAGAERAANIPNVALQRSGTIDFKFTANPRFRTYFKNVVVATGVSKLYDALAKDGSFTTRGILFDVNKDVLRPESTPVLEELRQALADHADLKVAIEGHTDNTGEDAHNQALSERRAQAVVKYLSGAGIAADRLKAEGKGETAPVADNNTAAGREQNRRVVIRKM